MLVGTWGRQQLWWGLEAGRELLAHSRVTNSTCFAFENLIETIDMEENTYVMMLCIWGQGLWPPVYVHSRLFQGIPGNLELS